MRGAPFFAALVLLAAAALPAQVRVERDAQGKVVITNKGSRAAKELTTPSAVALPKVSDQERTEIRQKLKAACDKRGLDYNLVTSLVRAESAFRQNTISKKGAIGLMQLLPDTAKRFGVSDPWDLDQNIEAGTAFLAFLHGRFPGDVPLILASYNAGENAVGKYGNKIPPYAETVRYVFRILEDYGKPELIAKAKGQLATAADYDRFYVPYRNVAPVLRVYYMSIDAKGLRSITDYPPSGVQFIPIVYRDE